MGGTGKKSEPPNKDDGKPKKPPPRPVEDDDSRMATSPPRSATADEQRRRAAVEQHPRISASLHPVPAKLLALDAPDTLDIEQMRAPAAARESDTAPGCGEQQQGDHRQRHRADPVQPHRRQFLGAAGIRSAAGRQMPALPDHIAPRAAARRASQQRLHRTDGSARRRGFPAAPRAPRRAKPAAAARPDRARRDTRSSVRPAADCNRSAAARAILGHDAIDRQRAVPGELLVRFAATSARSSRPDNALLDRLAAAGAGGDLPIGMKAEQFAAAEHGLRLLDHARDEFLHQHFIGERAAGAQLLQRAFQIIARCAQTRCRGWRCRPRF